MDFPFDKSAKDSALDCSVATGQDLDGPFSRGVLSPFFDAVSADLCPLFAVLGPFSCADWTPSMDEGTREALLVVDVDMGAVEVVDEEVDELLLSRTLARFSISALKFSMSI